MAHAYRMVGSVAEAEDLVQEAYLRLHRAQASGEQVGAPKAWLMTTLTRLGIDHLRSARVRRETYVGEWLPEPLVDEYAADVAQQVATADSLSMAFVLVLERLGPVERAVFLLREIFDYGYGEIAEIVGRSEDACRQILSRARRRVEDDRPRFEPSEQEREELGRRFVDAVREGDVDALVELLAADAQFHGDGGGKAPSVRAPVVGAERIAELIAGFHRVGQRRGATIEAAHVGGQPGLLIREADGTLVGVWSMDVADGAIQMVRGVTNPDKLRHLSQR